MQRPDLHWLAEGISAYSSEGAGIAWDPTFSAVMTPETSLAELGGWSIPTLCLGGTEDVYVPLAVMRAVAKELTGASLVEFSGAGHWTFLEQPGNYNSSVLKFLMTHLW